MGDEDRDEGITRAEFDELRSSLTGLSDAVRELREARTPDERRRAHEDVEDAEEDIDATAKRLGVSRASLESSIAAARRAERKEELRPVLEELLEELKGSSDDDDEDDDGAGDGAGPKKKPAAKKKPATKKPPASSSDDDEDDDRGGVGDTEPIVPHWSERGIGALLK